MRLKVDLNSVTKNSGGTCWIYLKNDEFETMADVAKKLQRNNVQLCGVDFRFYIDGCLVPMNESVEILKSDDILVLRTTNGDVSKIFPAVSVTTSGDTNNASKTSDRDQIRNEASVGSRRGENNDESSSCCEEDQITEREYPELLLRRKAQLEQFVTTTAVPSTASITSLSGAVSAIASHLGHQEERTGQLQRTSTAVYNDPADKDNPGSPGLSIISHVPVTSQKSHHHHRNTKCSPRTARRLQLEDIRARLAVRGGGWETGSSWPPRGSGAAQLQLVYECGGPELAWLCCWSPALPELDQVVQKLRRRVMSREELEKLRVGSLVLATYLVDRKLYRARIERISGGRRERERMYRVRYLDYGNYNEVAAAHLQPWHPALGLDTLPAQAITCRLRAAGTLGREIRPRSGEVEEFSRLVKQSNPVKMKIYEIEECNQVGIHSRTKYEAPQLLVDLFDSSGENVLKKWALSSNPQDCINEDPVNNCPSASARVLAKENLDHCFHVEAAEADDDIVNFPAAAGTVDTKDKVRRWLRGLEDTVEDGGCSRAQDTGEELAAKLAVYEQIIGSQE